MKKKRYSSALKLVNKFCPQVEVVRDATRPAWIEVTSEDQRRSKQLKHAECAAAVSCKRIYHLDAVIMSIGTAYLIKDRTATRYRVPSAIQREIVSFDRGAGFAAGQYKLVCVDSKHKLGARDVHRGATHGNAPKRKVRHTTFGIRALLNQV